MTSFFLFGKTKQTLSSDTEIVVRPIVEFLVKQRNSSVRSKMHFEHWKVYVCVQQTTALRTAVQWETSAGSLSDLNACLSPADKDVLELNMCSRALDAL